MKDNTIRDEERDIFYDPTDDAFEDEVAGIKTDDEIFTDEYMLAFADEADREIRRHKRMDRIVTVSVILIVALCVAMVVRIFI